MSLYKLSRNIFSHSATKRKQLFRLRTPPPFKLNGCSLNTIATRTLADGHGSIMTFNNLNRTTFDLNMNYYLTIDQYEVILYFSDPNDEGLTHWPKYFIDSKLYVNLNKESVTLGANVHKDNIKLLLETIPNQSKKQAKTEL